LEEEPLMLFVLSKIFGFLLTSNFFFWRLELLVTRWRRFGRWCIGVSLVVMLLAVFQPAARS
jgi:hypothetical protein